MLSYLLYCFYFWLSLYSLCLAERDIPERLTFELADRENTCFHSDLKPKQKYILQYRVLRGGANDVDIEIHDPNEKIIFTQHKGHHDEHEFAVQNGGTYSFCFSNTFSSISHKIVFFELRNAEFDTLEDEANVTMLPKAETLLETYTEEIHKRLAQAEDIQTDLRSKEREDRWVRYDLYTRVVFWSTITCIVIILTGIGQVVILKSLFPEKARPLNTFMSSH